MKRQQLTNTDEYIDWLKSKNCVFYAPMDESHGLSELIQGWIPNVNPNMSVTWDNSLNAYKLTGNSTANATLMYNGKTINPTMIGQYGKNMKSTIIFDFYMTNDIIGWEVIAGIGGSDDFSYIVSGSGSNRNIYYFCSRGIYDRNSKPCSLNVWHSHAAVRNTTNIRELILGNTITQIESVNSSSWAWIYNQTADTHVSFSGGCVEYIKNVYIFNTNLNDTDLITIYNHDHK